MIKELQIVVLPHEAFNTILLKEIVAENLGVDLEDVSYLQVLRRSIDARSRQPKYNLKVFVVLNEVDYTPVNSLEIRTYKKVDSTKVVVIIGAGPAGLFAALRLLELGIKPIIFERGKTVKDRRRDLAAITKEHKVNSDSNYCFGEGGAGTYSDGKLYTRSTKRGDVTRILNTLVFNGASADIMVDAHPHIGTNKLPQIIEKIRETILEYGGEIHFNTKVTDIIVAKKSVSGVRYKNVITGIEEEKICKKIILATGHSARDIFEMLYKKGILIESKPFALGVRAEHPQSLIDSIQYHCTNRGEFLPPASYALVTQTNQKGVYSFCMCPGGIIAPCATEQNQVVTNGWSPSKRNNPFANSGIVVEVKEQDLAPYAQYGPLAGMYLQKEIEEKACKAGGNTQVAPAQRIIDFVNRKVSTSIPDCSYLPGVKSANMHDLLPKSFAEPLANAFKDFGNKMKGYLSSEAVMVGFETRTSSPVRIPRNRETYQHPEITGLFPCAEGAGYAGGIVSAAIDGEKCAEACV